MMVHRTLVTCRWFALLGIASSLSSIAPARASSALQIEDTHAAPARPERIPSERPARETSFTGTVIDPDGKPLARAVVVTSAGGQAVTEGDGSFHLRVPLPSSSTFVQVTAVAGARQGSSVASAQVPTLSVGGTLSTGTLNLPLTTSCHPDWLPTFGSPLGTDGPVWALAIFDDGSGPALYVGGTFATAGGVAVNGIAKWSGSSWSPLGSGGTGVVGALTVFDDGSGPALFVGGGFVSSTGGPGNHIAKWNGSSWSPLASGLTSPPPFDTVYVDALTVFDDGTGPALYVGGSFPTAGGVAVQNIAKWDGSTWSPLGSGIGGMVHALTVFDDGTGAALYVGGHFITAGGAAIAYIAKWNGSSWSAVGNGVNLDVTALTVFDDGSGPALYAGGGFTSASGVAANRIAKWDGSSWSALGGGVSTLLIEAPTVYALTVFDDGGGPALYAGGGFVTAGSVLARHIAKWDGSSWSALGSGVNGAYPNITVDALAVFDDGNGPALYMGGAFPVSPAGDRYLSRWGCTYVITGPPFCFGDGTQATPCPCANNGATGHGCANSVTAAGALLTASGTTMPDTAVLFGTGMPATAGAIYLKGDQDNGTGALFGDGVLCADGNLVRLRTKQNVGGASQFPDATDTVSLSVRGGTPPGSGLTGYYQVYYRNAAASFCPPATFNMSNGFKITW